MPILQQTVVKLKYTDHTQVGRKNISFFTSIIKIADKRDHSYAMFLTNVEVC
jgi:hypothetical protein